MHKDGGDDVGILDASDHPELAAAFGAGLDIDGEDRLQALHPGHGSELFMAFLLAELDVEVVAVGVAHEEALAFQQPSHALGDAVQQPGELGGSRPWRPVEHRARTIE